MCINGWRAKEYEKTTTTGRQYVWSAGEKWSARVTNGYGRTLHESIGTFANPGDAMDWADDKQACAP